MRKSVVQSSRNIPPHSLLSVSTPFSTLRSTSGSLMRYSLVCSTVTWPDPRTSSTSPVSTSSAIARTGSDTRVVSVSVVENAWFVP